MVDAQAPGLAERLRALAAVPHSGPGWDGRLLEEYALLRLLAVACRDQGRLPQPLRDTVRSRIGFTVRQAEVLASAAPVRDRWQVLARRDLESDRIRTRRTWLRGRRTGRAALVLSFAAAGAAARRLAGGRDRDRRRPGFLSRGGRAARPGRGPARCGPATQGSPATRGCAAIRGCPATRSGRPPAGTTAAGLLAGYAAALAEDPWLDTWPAVLDATPARVPRPALRDADGGALPLHPGAGDCWPLFALSGGRPLTVAGEWTPRGLWPLTGWDESGRPVPL